MSVGNPPGTPRSGSSKEVSPRMRVPVGSGTTFMTKSRSWSHNSTPLSTGRANIGRRPILQLDGQNASTRFGRRRAIWSAPPWLMRRN